MDVTNRSLVIGFALIWISLAVFVILLTWAAPDESITRLRDFVGYLNHHNSQGEKLVITFGGLIFILLGAILVVVELAPSESGSVRVGRVGSGEVRIGIDEVQQRLVEELRGTPDLGDVQVAIAPRGSKAEVRLDLFISPDSDLTAVTDAALRHAREVVESRMGIELADAPKARVHLRDIGVNRPVSSYQPPSTRNPFTPPTSTASGTGASTSETSRGTASESPTEDRAAGA
jgi:hypothetical protein